MNAMMPLFLDKKSIPVFYIKLMISFLIVYLIVSNDSIKYEAALR